MLYTFHFGCSEMIQQACRKRRGGLNIGQTADKKVKNFYQKVNKEISLTFYFQHFSFPVPFININLCNTLWVITFYLTFENEMH